VAAVDAGGGDVDVMDWWYYDNPAPAMGSAHSVSGEPCVSVERPIGFIWPEPDPKAIVLPTPAELSKYA
jgi:hypothetical protein